MGSQLELVSEKIDDDSTVVNVLPFLNENKLLDSTIENLTQGSFGVIISFPVGNLRENTIITTSWDKLPELSEYRLSFKKYRELITLTLSDIPQLSWDNTDTVITKIHGTWIEPYEVQYESRKLIERKISIEMVSSSMKISLIALLAITIISASTSIWSFIIGKNNLARFLLGPSLSGILGLFFIISTWNKIHIASSGDTFEQ